MNRDEKAAVIEEVAREIGDAEAIFAVDYRGISVKQAAELRGRVEDAGARFLVVKNRLSARAADQAGVDSLKTLLEGPTALTFVRGDAATAAKELAGFRREHGLLVFKGGLLNGDALSADDVEAISRLPAREALYGQLVGVTASPLNGLVRGLAGVLSGLASQLGQIRDQGLVGGDGGDAEAAASASEPAGEADATEAAASDAGDASADAAEGNGASSEETPAEETPAEEAPGDPVAEAASAEEAPGESESADGETSGDAGENE
jgi:large subunit ribosomal protein L10